MWKIVYPTIRDQRIHVKNVISYNKRSADPCEKCYIIQKKNCWSIWKCYIIQKKNCWSMWKMLYHTEEKLLVHVKHVISYSKRSAGPCENVISYREREREISWSTWNMLYPTVKDQRIHVKNVISYNKRSADPCEKWYIIQ